LISCLSNKVAPNFTCTGYDGSKVWKEIHQIHNKIDCGHCADHAKILFLGVHDHVNIGLGKPAFDPKNYHWFAKEVARTYQHGLKNNLVSVA